MINFSLNRRRNGLRTKAEREEVLLILAVFHYDPQQLLVYRVTIGRKVLKDLTLLLQYLFLLNCGSLILNSN